MIDVGTLARIGWWLLAASLLVPKFPLGGYSLGLEDLLALAGLPLAIAWLVGGKYRGVWHIRTFTVLWFVIVGAGIFFGIVHSAFILDRPSFPGEMWQYTKRMVYFLLAIRFVHAGWVQPAQALRTLLLVMVALNAIGLLQLNGPAADFLSSLYSQDDVQLEALIDHSLESTRNYSVTGFSTSWGGLAAFIFAVALALFIHGRRALLSAAPAVAGALLLALAAMSLLNVFFSGSRAALLSVAVVVPAAILLVVTGTERPAKRIHFVSAVAAGALAVAFVAMTFFAERLGFIQYRNEALVVAYYAGASRFADIELAMGALTDWYLWLFGVGNAVQRALYVSYGVEVEPVYLLVNYGLFGLVLRYALLAAVGWRAMRLFRHPEQYPEIARPLGFACLAGLIAYATFSLGYFFFQESVVGSFPWLLFGALVGLPRVGPLARNLRQFAA